MFNNLTNHDFGQANLGVGDIQFQLRAENELSSHGQEHILTHLQKLEPLERQNLVEQICKIDWSDMANVYHPPDLQHVEPCDIVTIDQRQEISPAVVELGIDAYRSGEVAIFVVAGGDGSRLGFDAPKGCFLLSPISKKSMYQVLSEKVKKLGERFDYSVPFILMTGPNTHDATMEIFARHSHYRLDRSQVEVFCQGSVPTLDENGKLLLADRTKLLENPNGHGGSIEGLMQSGILTKLREAGIKELIYAQVDNLLLPFFDPFAVGLRRVNDLDIVTKVLRKTNPDEKVGALARVNGSDTVVEYSDLSEAQKHQKLPHGDYLFNFGNVGSHVISTEFLNNLMTERVSLPYHLAKKLVKVWSDGHMISTQAVKRERFTFDILPLSRNICLEIDRDSEFAPLKNATGVDSVETARRLMTKEFSRWLSSVGVEVDIGPDNFIEISPTFALDLDEFKSKWGSLKGAPTRIVDDYYLE